VGCPIYSAIPYEREKIHNYTTKDVKVVYKLDTMQNVVVKTSEIINFN